MRGELVLIVDLSRLAILGAGAGQDLFVRVLSFIALSNNEACLRFNCFTSTEATDSGFFAKLVMRQMPKSSSYASSQDLDSILTDSSQPRFSKRADASHSLSAGVRPSADKSSWFLWCQISGPEKRWSYSTRRSFSLAWTRSARPPLIVVTTASALGPG